jgi:hypothetical protein
MKKIAGVIILFCISTHIYSQTNIFPTSGGVGIGTVTPTGQLSLNNAVANTSNSHNPVNYNTSGFAIFNSYYVVNSDGSGSYPRYLDIVSMGSPDGSNGGGNIRFLTNPITASSFATERMRIASNGYVGIGTPSPAYQLDVNGTGNVSGNFNVANTLAYGRAVISTSETKSNSTWTAASTALFLSTQETDEPFGIKFGVLGNTTAANRFVSLQTGEHNVANSGNLLLQKEGGNVGIGTGAPINILHVAKASGTAYSSLAQLRVSSGGTNGNRAAVILSDDQLSDAKISYLPAAASADRLLSLSASSTESDFVIRGDGNIGIGTLSPSEKLSIEGNISVNGTIKSKKIKVTQSGWADYVFDNDYTLRSLASLEKYIGLNKHLPGVPSAKEVGESGIDLGDTQALLLKKIEELTLYIINLKKENVMHQKQMLQLAAKIKKLEDKK